MVCSWKRMLKLEKRGENGASQKERGIFSPLLLPSFLLSPYHLPLGLLFLLSLIFLRHNKDGGYNSTNITKQLSPAQNTPALQAIFGFNSLSHEIKIQIPICCPCTFPRSEKLLKYQLIVSCVIISLILITNLFCKALISLGEVWYWSHFGFKGLIWNV